MKVEFSGGLETLFDDRKTIDVEAPANETLLWLLNYLADQINGDKSLFLQDGLVRPGVLVLINDTDWELLDEENYILQPKDVIHFASTLHGG